MPKTIQQAEQDVLAAVRAWVLVDKKFTAACDEEKAAGRWRPGLETAGLSDNWKSICREAGAATEAMRAASYALHEADAAGEVIEEPTYRYGKGAPCVDEIERDAAEHTAAKAG